jgi:hypothetical protein
MAFPKNIDVQLFELGPLIQEDLARTKQTPSEWMREAAAMRLGVPNPDVKQGNPTFGNKAAGEAGAAARWQKPSDS